MRIIITKQAECKCTLRKIEAGAASLSVEEGTISQMESGKAASDFAQTHSLTRGKMPKSLMATRSL